MLQVMSMYRRLVVVMNPQSARACPELRAKVRQVRKSCTDCRGAVRMEERGVVSGGVVPERGETGVVGGRKDKGLLGEDREDGGVRGSDGVEQVGGGIENGIVAVDIEELAGRTVEAVEWHVVGVDLRPQEQRMRPGAPTSEYTGGSKRSMRRDIVYSMGERKECRP